MTLNETAEFWDTHFIAADPWEVGRFEFGRRSSRTCIAIHGGLLSRLESLARERGIVLEALVNLRL